MKVTAQLNYFHTTPRKMRLVANLIKGMTVPRAEIELQFLSKRAALPMQKLLKSAVANAEHNFSLSKDGLYIVNVVVNPGPMIKRMTPRAFGRGALVRKRMSHVTLTLETKETPHTTVKQAKKLKPLVREITPEDAGGDSGKGHHKKDIVSTGIRKGKTANFVRRVFSRKAI